MVNKQKRGQGSVEYMIIAAIVLVLAAVVTTVFLTQQQAGQNTKLVSSSIYWQDADIKILQLAVNTTNARITVQNNLGYAITMTEIKLNQYRSSISVTLPPGNTTQQLVTYIHDTDTEGQVFTITPTFSYSYASQQLTFEGEEAIKGSVTTGAI